MAPQSYELSFTLTVAIIFTVIILFILAVNLLVAILRFVFRFFVRVFTGGSKSHAASSEIAEEHSSPAGSNSNESQKNVDISRAEKKEH